MQKLTSMILTLGLVFSQSSATLATATLNLTNATACAATAASTSYGTGLYVSAGLSLTGSTQQSHTQAITNTASILQANNNLHLNANNSITQIGSITLADNTLSYNANNDITIESSKDTHSSKQSYKDFQTTLEYGTNGFGMQANFSQSHSRSHSITHNNSLALANNISINTAKALNLISSNIQASNTLQTNANSLNIESKHSNHYATSNGLNIGVGYGSNATSNGTLNPSNINHIANAHHNPTHSHNTLNKLQQNAKSLHFNLGINSSNINTQWIENQASLLANNQASINIKANTHLAGGILASKQEALTLHTDTLTHINLNNNDYSKQQGVNLQLSASDTNIALQNLAHNKDGIAYSTLGRGNITINDKQIESSSSPYFAERGLKGWVDSTSNNTNSKQELQGLNRDLSHTAIITKDTQTNALHTNLSIDNRIFNSNGRKDIKSDIANFKDNAIKASIGASITTLNPLLTTYQILHSKSNPNKDERISFRESINQWKSNQTTMVNTNRLANAQNRNILNNIDNIDNPQSLESIHNALNPSENLHINFYYDDSDNALGFFDKTSKDKNIKQIYLNTAKGITTNTHTFINTYNHEISHQYTSNETIANNAGKLGNFLYNTINVLNGDKASTNKHSRNNALSKNGNTNFNSANWLASQSPYAKSILHNNTYNNDLDEVAKLLYETTYQQNRAIMLNQKS